MLNKISLLFHTLRYLKFSQIIGRVKHRFQHPVADMSPAPALAMQSGEWVGVACRSKRMFKANGFEFLNVRGGLGVAEDWNASRQSKLWLYNLHYFDDLNSLDFVERRDWHCLLVQRWIDENPVGFGNGWEPYPASLRIVNWIKWGLSGVELEQNWNHSLAVQVRYLEQQLEYHLLGNHLFANAKALVFAGLYFEGDEADKWLETGFSILAREVPEQILPDGGQFELSPMYHAIALEDMLDLINLCSLFSEHVPVKWRGFATSLREVSTSMLKWMITMNHPDNGVAFFNDTAFDIAPSSSELLSYAERLGFEKPFVSEGCIYLEDSGYLRVKKAGIFALLDIAPIGPDYLPGHAHADTLSFELSLFDQRVLVNSGTSCYGADDERSRQRGTAAHNTVVINGEDSSEVWSGFRVARRAKPFDISIDDSTDGLIVGCSHTGYKRLKGKPVHHRQWSFKDNELVVDDTILGEYQTGEAHFHFHPDVSIQADSSCLSGCVLFSNDKQIFWEVLSGDAELEPSTFHPEFGISLDNFCLVVYFRSPQATIRFYW